MDISCLDNHLPTGVHPQLTTSILFFTRRISSTFSQQQLYHTSSAKILLKKPTLPSLCKEKQI
jgi:hypothetical protein